MNAIHEFSSLSFWKTLGKRIQESDLTGFAAQLAYFFLLSLFPLLIFLVTLLSYLPFTVTDVLDTVRNYAPGQTMDTVEETLTEVMTNRNGGLLSFGIIATIWTASNGMNAVIKSLNRAYEVSEERPFYIQRGLSVLLTIGMILVFIIALLLPVFGKQIGNVLDGFFGFSQLFDILWGGLRFLVSPLVLITIFIGVYYLAPNLKIKCTSAFPGAIFATLGWILISLAFSFYVSNFANYSATYGSIGGIIVLMVWFYLTGIILLVGGEINALMNDRLNKRC